MRASVIVAAHNEGERLWKTVDAIFDSSPRLDFELLVADDASTDGSVSEAQQRFPRIIVVSHRKREGVAATRVLAAGRARGEVLIFLDGHTRPDPGSLERLVQDVESTKGNAVITPQIVGLDEGTWQVLPQQTGNGYAVDLETFDSWWISLKKMKEVKEGGRSFYESPALIGCALAIDRKLYDQVWGFDTHMRSWGNEDIDLALKVWTLGGRVLHDPAAVVAHRFQRFFEAYEVTAEYPLANQIRSARKHFTQSVWEDWLERAQQRSTKKLWGHPEGVWARAWEVFQQDRKSAEHERAYLLGRRQRDEFWYASRFERSWPATGGLVPLKATTLPSRIRYAVVEASPAPHLDSIEPDFGGQGQQISVTLGGTNFSGAKINAPDGVTATVTNQTTSEIDGEFDISGDAPLNDDASVSVTNADGQQSNSVQFSIYATPFLESIDPGDGVQGTTVPVTISGTGLQGATINSISGITITDQDNPDQETVTADFVIASDATEGDVPVNVTNESGVKSNSVLFTIDLASPEIDPPVPNHGLQGVNVSVSIIGSNFANATINPMEGITITITSQTPSEIDATFAISKTAPTGIQIVTVTNQNGQTSNSQNFTVDPVYWGVDSAAASNGTVSGETYYAYVTANGGAAPGFWGRYLETVSGSHNGLTSTEITFLHGKDCKILLIYGKATSSSVKGSGVTDGNYAISEAKALGIPANSTYCIYADVEASWQPTASWIEQFAETVQAGGYRVGFYCNPGSNFSTPFCTAYNASEAVQGSYLWSTEPEPGCTTEPNAPNWNPTSPSCYSAGTVAWQYAETCLKASSTYVADLDLGTNVAYAAMY
jgi:GT2 family glycosyltransferase